MSNVSAGVSVKRSQARIDEEAVAEFLRTYNLEVERIPERDVRTPDFLVSTQSGYSFYCEVKGIEGIPLSEPFLYRKANDRLKEDLKRAREQFRAVNAARLVPNILAWVSHDQRIVTLDDIVLLVEGVCITPGMRRWVQPGFQFRKSAKYKTEVDLFILIPKRGGPGCGPSFFVREDNADFASRLRRIFHLPLLTIDAGWRRMHREPRGQCG